MKVGTFLLGICMVSVLISFGQQKPDDSNASSSNELAVSNIDIYAPNAFTPDGNNHNDTWNVNMNGIDIYDFHLSVYNRTGQLIWESYDINGEWDGSFDGYDAPSGIYVWMIDAKDVETDKRYQYDGFIHVLR